MDDGRFAVLFSALKAMEQGAAGSAEKAAVRITEQFHRYFTDEQKAFIAKEFARYEALRRSTEETKLADEELEKEKYREFLQVFLSDKDTPMW